MPSHSEPTRSPLVVLGMPGLDWQRLQRLVERGELPRFARLLDEGTWAPVHRPTGPADSVWTTFATGVPADVHGVLHPLERLDGTLFVRGVDATSLRSPAFASMAARAGRRVASVGWPCTDGLVLDGGWAIGPAADLATGARDADAPLDPRAASPAAAADTVRASRLHPRDIAHADLAFFLAPLPPAARARIAPALAAALARAGARQAWATEALALAPDIVLLHWPWLADMAALLRPLAQAAESATAAEAVLDRCLHFADLALDPYLAPPHAHPHGAARVLVLSDAAFVLAAGPGVARDRMADPLAATEVFDLLSALAGLAPAGRAPCAILRTLLTDSTPAQPADFPLPPRALVARDLVDDFDAHPTPADEARMARAPAVDWTPWRAMARTVRRETLLALAQGVAGAGRVDEALATLRQLLDETPDFLPARVLAARLAWTRGRPEEFAALAETGRQLHGDGPLGDTAHAIELLARRDWPAFDRALAALMARPVWVLNLHAVAARAHQLRGDAHATVDALAAAVAHDPRDATAWLALGEATGRIGRHADAIRAIGRAVSLLPGQRAPLMQLSEAQRQAGDAVAAAQTLLRATLARP